MVKYNSDGSVNWIGHIWDRLDVINVAKEAFDAVLTEVEIDRILISLESNCDSDQGITWHSLESEINDVVSDRRKA